jgi:hypothetical protein
MFTHAQAAPESAITANSASSPYTAADAFGLAAHNSGAAPVGYGRKGEAFDTNACTTWKLTPWQLSDGESSVFLRARRSAIIFQKLRKD